jgi:SPP1 gp7 family putative phage head morphogenesis protein
MPNPPRQPTDDAAITRALASDSEALRYAEWWVRRRIYGLQDQEARWLYRAYGDAYRSMRDALDSAYTSDGDARLGRLDDLLRQIEREMDMLLGMVVPHTAQSLEEAFRQGYYGRAWSLDMATNEDVPITLRPWLPTEAIRAMLLQPVDVKRRRPDWLTEIGLSRDEFIARVRSSLTRSLIGGEGMAAAQRRLRDELGIETDRRKGFKRNFYQTLITTRTEVMKASNLGALAIYEENSDLLSGAEFVAARDGRTCPYCGGLDGTRWKFGDPGFIVPPSQTHPGCRCTLVPVLMDTALMDRVAGVRQTYAQWKAGYPAILDGGLDDQRGAEPPALNEV